MNNKEKSPFTPGSPVPYELFVGRAEQIQELIRLVEQTALGKQENIFLAGDRGIGKSSLASFLRYFVCTKKNLLGVHAFLGKAGTLEKMVCLIFEQILKEAHGQSWFDNISQLFGKFIKQIGLFGISVSFNPPAQDLKDLTKKFPEALNNLINKIKDYKAGLFIALDDVNGLVEKAEFANWYKSFVDEIATHYRNFPVFIMVIGLPEKRDILAKLQPSILRIFRVVNIEKLSDGEVKQFLEKAFSSANIKVEPDAMKSMAHYSSGLPILMHEIGDATFWLDKDGTINGKDALTGIAIAAEKVGEKYLDPKVYRAIRSPHYRSILRKFGEISIPRNFIKRAVEEKLNESDKKVFHNFLRRMRDLGIIEPDIERGSGAYRFVNEIYPIYIWMESERAKRVQ